MDEKRIKTNYLETAGIMGAVLAVPVLWVAWRWTGIQAPAMATYWCVFGLPTTPIVSMMFKVDLPRLAAWLQEQPALGPALIWHTEIASIAGSAAAGAVAWKFGWHEIQLVRKRQLSGPIISDSLKEAAGYFGREAANDPAALLIHPGGVCFSRRRLTSHICTVAGSGRGKSVSMSVPMRDAIHGRQKSLILDPKLEWLPNLELPDQVVIYAPQDARSVAFSPASGAGSLIDLHQLAGAFIPDIGGENSFFAQAARDVMTGILLLLQTLKPGAWTYADVVEYLDMIAADPARFCAEVGSVYPASAAYIAGLVARQGNKTAEAVRAELLAATVPIRVLGAAFAGRETFDFREWITEPDHPVRTVIIVPSGRYHQLTSAAFEPVFRLMAATVVSDVPDNRDPKRAITMFLDEFNSLPPLGDAMIDFAQWARSKNVALWISLQDIIDLQVRQFKGHAASEAAAKSFLANFSTYIMLGSGALGSAKWCSEQIGQGQFEITARGKSIGPDGKASASESSSLLTEPIMTPEQISAELGNTGGGVKGIIVGGNRPYRITWPYWEKPAKALRPAFVAADWTQEFGRYQALQARLEAQRNILMPAAKAEAAAGLVIELGARR